MGVEIKKVEPDLRLVDRWILLESAGCQLDNEKAQIYEYSFQSCVLFLNALAKKILGIYGIAIGNDPRRAAELGLATTRDFTEDRKKIVNDPTKSPEEKRNALENLRHEEQFANKLASEYDAEAWQAVIELEQVLERRAMSLERAGLVETNVDDLVPEAVALKEKQEYGTDGKIPCRRTVAITSKGLKCISQQKWPVPKKKQRPGVSRFDEDVEVPGLAA
jgi:hypothetical protein